MLLFNLVPTVSLKLVIIWFEKKNKETQNKKMQYKNNYFNNY